ncbi:hypothetical protein P692DRAFT_20744008 [Suillus brevipes Sb2]|nr:hypothetical protein P692DRAFT_20744008 [Suillus brevipes Sb2]
MPTARNAGKDGETTKKTKRKTAVHVVIPSDHTSDSDEDDDQPRAPLAKSAKKQAVWNIKGLSCLAKQQPKSTSQVAGDDSEDEFNAPDSSEAPSEEDMSDAGKNTHTRKQTAVPPKKKPAHPTKPSAGRVQSNAPDKMATTKDSSASRAPPTPIEKPRRVGLASQMASTSQQVAEVQLQGKKRGREAAMEGLPEKHVRMEVKTKKRAAECRLEESPAKCTSSKTAEVPPKRSKKPNSRYAGNFVKS